MKDLKVGDRVKLTRVKLKITQVSLANKIKMTQQGLSLIENNKVNPPTKCLRKICAALGVSFEYIVTGFISKNNYVKIALIKKFTVITEDESMSDFSEFIMIDKKYAHCFSTVIQDDSSLPFVSKDTIVVIDPTKKLENGSLVAITKNENIYICKHDLSASSDAEMIGIVVLKIKTEEV